MISYETVMKCKRLTSFEKNIEKFISKLEQVDDRSKYENIKKLLRGEK